MRALIKVRRGYNSVELREVKIPKIKSKHVLVKVKAAGICGTDFHIFEWTPWADSFALKIPLILGHEFSGQVVEVGEDVTNLSIDDKVAVEPHIPCGSCYHCETGYMHICQKYNILGIHSDGAFAEYSLVPAVCVYRLPQKVSYEEGAIFEPAGMAVHAVGEAQIDQGDIIAVFGCGPIGLFSIQAARASGALMVIAADVNPYRLGLATKAGADMGLNPKKENFIEKIRELAGDKNGVDIVIEASGSPDALRQGLIILRKAGKMIIIGLPSKPVNIDISKNIVLKEVTIKGVHGRIMWETWKRTEDLVISNLIKIKPIITHKIRLTEFRHGLELMRKQKTGKVLLKL